MFGKYIGSIFVGDAFAQSLVSLKIANYFLKLSNLIL